MFKRVKFQIIIVGLAALLAIFLVLVISGLLAQDKPEEDKNLIEQFGEDINQEVVNQFSENFDFETIQEQDQIEITLQPPQLYTSDQRPPDFQALVLRLDETNNPLYQNVLAQNPELIQMVEEDLFAFTEIAYLGATDKYILPPKPIRGLSQYLDPGTNKEYWIYYQEGNLILSQPEFKNPSILQRLDDVITPFEIVGDKLYVLQRDYILGSVNLQIFTINDQTLNLELEKTLNLAYLDVLVSSYEEGLEQNLNDRVFLETLGQSLTSEEGLSDNTDSFYILENNYTLYSLSDSRFLIKVDRYSSSYWLFDPTEEIISNSLEQISLREVDKFLYNYQATICIPTILECYIYDLLTNQLLQVDLSSPEVQIGSWQETEISELGDNQISQLRILTDQNLDTLLVQGDREILFWDGTTYQTLTKLAD